MSIFSKIVSLVRHFGKYRLIAPFYLLKNRHKYSRENTVCVFAQPRGGSTWFSNLLLNIPDSAKIDEPLFRGEFVPDGSMPKNGVGKIKHLDHLNFYYHQPIPEDSTYPEGVNFFDRLFRFRFVSPYLFGETPLPALRSSSFYIFKFCEGNLLLPWLAKNFDVKCIALLRNPYAVIASQINFHSFQMGIKCGKYRIPSFQFSEFFDPYKPILNEISHPEEILAARWCLNYLPIINYHENNKSWMTISYEGLLLHSQKEISRLEHYLDKKDLSDLIKNFRNPSVDNYKNEDNYKDVNKHLSYWKEVLTKQQIARIDYVLERFKILGYNKGLEPDYSIIYNRVE